MIYDLDFFWTFFPIFIFIGIMFFILGVCTNRYRKAYTPEIKEIMKLTRQDPNYLQSHPEAQEKMKEFSRKVIGDKMYTRMTEKMQQKGIDPYNPQINAGLNPHQTIKINPQLTNTEKQEKTSLNNPEKQEQQIFNYQEQNSNKNSIRERNFAIVDGNTSPKYFVCPFCGADVKVGKDVCPKCKNAV